MKQKVNIFVSYSHKLRMEWVEAEHGLISILQKALDPNVEIWTDCYFAERGGAEYRIEIKRQIKQADIAVLLLSPEFFQSKFIMLEEFPDIKEEYLARELKAEKEGKQGHASRKLQIIPINIADPFRNTYDWIVERFQTLPNEQEYLVDYKKNADKWDEVKQMIIKSFQNAVDEVRLDREAEELACRKNNDYCFDDKREAKRLKKQTDLFHKYDKAIYDRIFEGREKCKVLNVGSNNGNNIAACVGSRTEVDLVVGIDKVENVIKKAKELYKTPKYVFSCMDCSAEEFRTNLQNLMNELGIKGFDVIHISMLLLHLQNPEKTLSVLREFLADDGCIFIRDIDDSLKLAYPDNHGRFERAFAICCMDKNSGYRTSGREIYSLLVKAGYHDIILCRKGLDTINMTPGDKDDFFNVCFSYIEEDLKYLSKVDSDNLCWSENLKWFEDNYNAMDDEFSSPDFFFQAGFMVYVAKK